MGVRSSDAEPVTRVEIEVSRRGFLRAAAAGLAPLVAGCIPDPTGPGVPPPDPARLTVVPTAPTETPRLGASWLDIYSVGRDALLYVPDGYDHEVPTPLLVTLHGRGRGAGDWEAFYPKCDARNIVMLAVESRGVTWDRAETGSFGPDVTFIDVALGRTFRQCNVDPTHIALAGFSDGASYALSLGPSNGDLFTHLVAFSPGFAAPGRQRYGRPRIWISAGRDDPVFDEDYTFTEIVGGFRQDDYEVQYVEFDGGHELPATISDAALDWFVA